jgi:hypothetical protein
MYYFHLQVIHQDLLSETSNYEKETVLVDYFKSNKSFDEIINKFHNRDGHMVTEHLSSTIKKYSENYAEIECWIGHPEPTLALDYFSKFERVALQNIPFYLSKDILFTILFENESIITPKVASNEVKTFMDSILISEKHEYNGGLSFTDLKWLLEVTVEGLSKIDGVAGGLSVIGIQKLYKFLKEKYFRNKNIPVILPTNPLTLIYEAIEKKYSDKVTSQSCRFREDGNITCTCEGESSNYEILYNPVKNEVIDVIRVDKPEALHNKSKG